jgi:hypothetical protein
MTEAERIGALDGHKPRNYATQLMGRLGRDP